MFRNYIMDDLVPYRLRSPDADASCRFLRTVARSVLRQYRNAHSRRLSRLTEEAAQFCIYSCCIVCVIPFLAVRCRQCPLRNDAGIEYWLVSCCCGCFSAFVGPIFGSMLLLAATAAAVWRGKLFRFKHAVLSLSYKI